MIKRLVVLFWMVWLWWSGAMPALAQAYKYYDPPLSFTGAELRGKDFSGQTMRSAEFALAHLEETSFKDADVQGSIFSSSRLNHADLSGANFSYGMVDKADFTGANLSDGIFHETLFLRAILDDVTIAGADFTDALLDGKQVRQLCAIAAGTNSHTGINTRTSLGCP